MVLQARTFVLLLSTALGIAGCHEQTVVRAWPGMSVSDFNRLNSGTSSPLKTDDLSWIGVSTPFTLVLPKSFSGLHIASTQRGAGLQVLSDVTAPSGRYLARPIIQILEFSIGDGSEPIVKIRPIVVSYCNALADAAGVHRVVLPNPDGISERLRRGGKTAILCAGSGRTMSFEIRASNQFDHWWYGRDERRAYLSGSLGMPEDWMPND